MGKKSKGNAGGDFWDDEEFAQDTPQAEEFGVSTEAAENQNEEDGEGEGEGEGQGNGGDFLSSIRKSKQKKQEKQIEEKNKPKDGPRVLSKKEKLFYTKVDISTT
jgi:translation initiation factor 5B